MNSSPSGYVGGSSIARTASPFSFGRYALSPRSRVRLRSNASSSSSIRSESRARVAASSAAWSDASSAAARPASTSSDMPSWAAASSVESKFSRAVNDAAPSPSRRSAGGASSSVAGSSDTCVAASPSDVSTPPSGSHASCGPSASEPARESTGDECADAYAGGSRGSSPSPMSRRWKRSLIFALRRLRRHASRFENPCFIRSSTASKHSRNPSRSTSSSDRERRVATIARATAAAAGT